MKRELFVAGLLALAASTVMWLVGYFWPWGWAVGGVLLGASWIINDD